MLGPNIAQLSISILDDWDAFETPGSSREVVEPEVHLIISLHRPRLTSSSRSASSTLHAFSHALDSLLAFARTIVMDCLGKDGDGTPSLNAIWAACENVANMLAACADVCGRVSASQGPPALTSQCLPGSGSVTGSVSSNT